MMNKELAKRTKTLRKNKGLSQEDLAEDSGLSLRTIQRIESGETEPTGDSLKKISSALNVTPDELMDWEIKEDRSFLKKLNLSALSFIFFPLLGILVPFILWVSQKDKLKDLNKIAKELINFEITWTIVLFIGFVTSPAIKYYTEGELSFRFIILSSLTLFAIMYTVNIVFIMFNTYLIHHEKEVNYFPKIRFLKQ